MFRAVTISRGVVSDHAIPNEAHFSKCPVAQARRAALASRRQRNDALGDDLPRRAVRNVEGFAHVVGEPSTLP
jgi:hypothetical protein